jgi:hypothetical protein
MRAAARMLCDRWSELMRIGNPTWYIRQEYRDEVKKGHTDIAPKLPKKKSLFARFFVG